MSDWDPTLYAQFTGPRLRPALDLLRAVGPLPAGPVVDLGCGSGMAGAALKGLSRRLIGVDASESMLDKAQATGTYDDLICADIQSWTPDDAPALIFSNAVLHWLADHDTLLPRLVSCLRPGGTLAVQVPHQNNAPSHRFWYSLGHEMFPDQVPTKGGPGILSARAYHALLSGLGDLSVWETEYLQQLPPAENGHPVRLFTQSTYARPVLDALSPDQQTQLITAYDTIVPSAYTKEPDGTVLFPFRRLFFTLSVEN